MAMVIVIVVLEAVYDNDNLGEWGAGDDVKLPTICDTMRHNATSEFVVFTCMLMSVVIDLTKDGLSVGPGSTQRRCKNTYRLRVKE